MADTCSKWPHFYLSYFIFLSSHQGYFRGSHPALKIHFSWWAYFILLKFLLVRYDSEKLRGKGKRAMGRELSADLLHQLLIEENGVSNQGPCHCFIMIVWVLKWVCHHLAPCIFFLVRYLDCCSRWLCGHVTTLKSVELKSMSMLQKPFQWWYSRVLCPFGLQQHNRKN